MAYRIEWSPKAAAHLGDICDYIAKDSELYAAVFATRVVAIVKAIPLFPRAGRIVPEYNDDNLREKFYESYRIVYRLKEDIIQLVAISHGSRILENVL